MDEHRAEMDVAQLVGEHHHAVFGYAYRLTGSTADAEDLTQQVYLTAQEKLGQLRNIECARTWLFAILRNLFWKSCQKRRPVSAGSLALNLNAIPEVPAETPEIDSAQLQQALDELPDRYRLVLAMFYYEDCSYREIAEQLDLPIGTVMSRLARAKALLRGKLLGADRQELAVRSEKSTSHGR
jgi:RNA polymerase sigma-70 factor, ECF subfamily